MSFAVSILSAYHAKSGVWRWQQGKAPMGGQLPVWLQAPHVAGGRTYQHFGPHIGVQAFTFPNIAQEETRRRTRRHH